MMIKKNEQWRSQMTRFHFEIPFDLPSPREGEEDEVIIDILF